MRIPRLGHGQLRSRVSSAHLVAVLALFAALAGGTAIALPGKNRVDSDDIRTGAVTSADVRNNYLRGVDIRKNSVTGADVRETTLDCGAIPNADCSRDDATRGRRCARSAGRSRSTGCSRVPAHRLRSRS